MSVARREFNCRQLYREIQKQAAHALTTFATDAIHKWRQRLQQRGLIAWPLKVDGKLSSNDRDLLFKGWYQLAIAHLS